MTDAMVRLENVTVEFTVFNAKSRSIKDALLRRTTGGILGVRSNDSVFVRALDRVSFTVPSGSRVAIVGGNGSGKTTLLRVIAGVFEPCAGVMIRRGRAASLLNFMLGMDLESTGRQNIFLRGTLLGLSPDALNDAVDDISEFAGLGPFLEMPVRTYSLGMRMRLALAISTSIEPDILLLDEWIGFGDQTFQQRAEKRMMALLERTGILILASHSEPLLERLCNRCILLSEGRVIEDGPVQSVLRTYHTMHPPQ